MTVPVAVGEGGSVRPTLECLFGVAEDAVESVATEVAGELWPGGVLRFDGYVPSVNHYVRRLAVDGPGPEGRALYAKYGFLGASLVSVLRGARGDETDVLAAQSAYLRESDTLLKRQADQLAVLERLPSPRVCRLVDYRRGVLLVEAVPARMSLAARLLAEPDRAELLLRQVWDELTPLHHLDVTTPVGRTLARTRAAQTPEGSIASVFVRKFAGPEAGRYLAGLGTGWFTSVHASRVRHRMTAVVTDLMVLLNRSWPAVAGGRRLRVAYGALKPDHILFPPTAVDPRPYFLDPTLHWADPTVDAAKLLSRIVLLLTGAQPGAHVAGPVVAGIRAWLDAVLSVAGTPEPTWTRDLLTLWWADTANILSTYLSMPRNALPVPMGAAVANHTATLCAIAHRATTALLAGHAAAAVMSAALTCVEERAGA